MQKFGILLLIILTVFFFGCAEKENSGGGQASKPTKGGTIIIGVTGDIDTFNPLFSRSALGLEVLHLTLLGLADLDEHGNFVPELAEKWEVSQDNLELTYYLRKNMKWSDGVPISAYDVEFTYQILMNPELGSPRSSFVELIKEVAVMDSFTVKFIFKEAYPAEMFDTAGEIVPKHIFESVPIEEIKTHSFNKEPLASGPYLVKRWDAGQYIEMVPNPYYYGEAPNLSRVVFKIVPNPSALLRQFESGEVDMVLDIPPDKADKLRNKKELVLFDVPGRVYYYIGYNHENQLFKEPAVRKALTLAVDRDKIINALLYGFGKPCVSSFLPQLTWAYNDSLQPLPYDPSEALNILRENGWSDTNGDGYLDRSGKTFQFTLKTNSDNQLRVDIAQVVQQQFKQIGIKVDISLLEWSAFMNDISSGEFDAYLGGLSSSLYIDPTPLYHSSAVDMFNYVHYANPLVDKLIESGRMEMNREKAGRIWKKLQRKIYEDQPYTYLFWIDNVVGVSNKFGNVTPVMLSRLYELEKWYKVN
ncbi:MAG: peptide-binding protein [Calditrichia bacterium]